jgi:hypothetical protein
MSIIFIIIIIIVILCIIYFIWRRYKAKVKDSSNGTWDAPAQAQAEALQAVPEAERTAADAYELGRLYELNMLEGQAVATAGNQQPIDRPAVMQTIFGNYHRALEAMMQGNAPRAEHGAIIMHIGGFNDRMMQDFGPHDAGHGILFEQGDEVDGLMADGLMADGGPYNINGPQVQRFILDGILGLFNIHKAATVNNIEQHKAAITTENPDMTAAQAGSVLLDRLKTNTSDGQNVHDSAVNRTTKQTYDRICAENNMTALARGQALADVLAAAQSNPRAAQAAQQIIDKPAVNSHLEATDAEVLAQIWARQSLPENKGRRDNLKAAALSALADMAEPGPGLVCVTGRTSRLLESLTLVDYDDGLAGAATVEQYRNEIFDKARHHIEEADRMADSNNKDTVLKAVYAECDSYADKLSATELNRIKDDCKAAVMF